jgi:mannose-6-phosphate isomerase-like protein (cupin superfamily)
MAKVPETTPEKKEAFHLEAESRIRKFRYETPALAPDEVKRVSVVCESDIVTLLVQLVKSGGENNLHYHTNSETCWMVLRGRARFYGPGGKLLGELGPHEGILIPGGSRYRFEKVGGEDLEILQLVGHDKAKGPHKRINLEPKKEWMKNDEAIKVYE